MSNNNLAAAKSTKNDEFYTQFKDIEHEIKAYVDYSPGLFEGKTVLLPCDNYLYSNFTRYFSDNFKRFGLKKLVSTCYSRSSSGTVFVVDSSGNKSVENLKGNGDFRSDEIKKYRSEADYIITNPPFSLYRDFIEWVCEDDKKFLVVGNKNSITYREIFPLILGNRLWSGVTKWSGGMWFFTDYHSENLANVASAWFTNIEHGRRHEHLRLSTMEENIKHGKHKSIRENGYQKYDNYDALEVPYSDAIPSDYSGVIGVPITFLEKHNPEQFQIIGATESEGKGFSNGLWDSSSNISQPLVNGKRIYKRFFIKKI